MKTRKLFFFLLAAVATTSTMFAGTPEGTGAPARGARGGGRGGRGGGMLSISNPSPSIKPVTTAVKAPDAEGFIQRWLLLEPIPVSGALGDAATQATIKKEYFPNQFTVMPHDGEKVTVDGTELKWHAIDTTEFNVNLLHYSRSINKPYENVLYWGVCVVNCPREMHNVRLTAGSNASSIWWVNGKEVIDIYQNRQSVVDDGVSRRLTLKQGPNVLRCAVINSTGATDFNARFLDADEKPLTDFTITLSDAGQ